MTVFGSKPLPKRQRRGLRKRENYEILLDMKKDYLDDFKERVDYLSVLVKGDRMFEATILASCYLGALSRLRYQNTYKEDQQSYIKFLLRYGNDSDLHRVSLPILQRNLYPFSNSETSDLSAWIHARISRKKTLSSIQTILGKFSGHFKKPEDFSRVVKKSTVAGVVYTAVRSRGVHEASSLTSRKSIELGNGSVVITGDRIIHILRKAFTAVRPYLESTHRWARNGKYA